MTAQRDPDTTDVALELSKQVSLASDLLAEQSWARAGEASNLRLLTRFSTTCSFNAEQARDVSKAEAGFVQALSVIHVNDKIIEEKERELVDCIAQNYSRIKGVERELAGLQLQLKLTSGPKKSALELLRRKIEVQNEKVVLTRGKFHAARKVAEAAEEALKADEAIKERLCQELNLLVQQSAHAQLERLEQLTRRMELLNQGFAPALDSDLEPRRPQAEAGVAELAPEAVGPESAAGGAAGAKKTAETSGSETDPISGQDDARPVEGAAASAQRPAGSPPQPQRPSKGSGQRRPELNRADQERAAAARARHVTLKSPGRPTPKAPAAAGQQRPGRQPNEPFQGFD